MKKTLILAVAVAFVAAFAAPVLAGDLPAPVDKFAKGTMEVIHSPIELYDHTKSEFDSAEHKPVGLLKGLVESPLYMVKKAGDGALKIATFPIK